MSKQLTGVIRNGRVEVADPIDLPEVTEVVVAQNEDSDDGSTSPDEIARVLAGMRGLEPLDIPDAVSGDLDH